MVSNLLELPYFLGRFFLVTLVNPVAHVTNYGVGSGVEGRCTNLFLKYWIDGYFLLGSNLFTYNEKELSEEA